MKKNKLKNNYRKNNRIFNMMKIRKIKRIQLINNKFQNNKNRKIYRIFNRNQIGQQKTIMYNKIKFKIHNKKQLM